MTRAPIAFVNRQESGLEELSGASPIAHNVFSDTKGCVRRRPGIVAHGGLTSDVVNENGINGVYATHAGRVFATSDHAASRLYEVAAGAALLRDQFPAGRRTVFAETDALLIYTGGHYPRKATLLTNPVACSLLDGAPRCSHIVANSARLFSNNLDDPSRVHYSATALGSSYEGHETWSGLNTGVVTGEARPDPVVAIHENTSDDFVFGSTTLQVFSPDPSFVISPTAVREFGCAAPYSVIKREQHFAWLDQMRRFVVSDGRSHDVISTPIQRTLDELSTVSDCFGYRVHMGPLDALVWTFPTHGRTFVFQEGLWSQWTGRTEDATWSPFRVTAATTRSTDNLPIVGLSTGEVATLSLDAHTDLGDPLPAHVETGYESRGTDRYKKCVRVDIALRRGQTQSATGPIAWLCWRDRPGPWTRLPIDLGASGDSEPVVTLWSLGVYRRRQWKFEFDGPEELVLVSAVEEFTEEG